MGGDDGSLLRNRHPARYRSEDCTEAAKRDDANRWRVTGASKSIMNRRSFIASAAAGVPLMLRAQDPTSVFNSNAPVAGDVVFACPMDPDVRSNQPGVCPRCGMKLSSEIPDPV